MAQLFRAVCAQDTEGQSDGQLLGEFVAGQDKVAFAALVRRHGPMVLAVCQRILGNASDAEDAFQATFLVLVRKAAALVSRRVVGDWLHGVARRTALNARRLAARRHVKEQQMARPEAQTEEVRNDWLPLLDEALSRLPPKYRLPIVLCDLESRSRREAAQRLGWPEGTVAGRLSRGRSLLAKELARHGLVISSGSLAAALGPSAASAAVPSAMVESTVHVASILAMGTGIAQAAQGAVPAKVVALAEMVVKAMFLTKIKVASCAAGMACLALVAGVALVLGSGPKPASGAAAGPTKVNQQSDAGKTDPEAEQLVRQLGSDVFAKREAASKELAKMGARAALAVRAGMKEGDLETVKRCEKVWPKLWKTEIERPEADRMAGFTHPLWVRFRKVAGDDASSRKLFAELAADLGWFAKLEAIDADPAKAADAYAAALKERVEALNKGWRDAEAAAQAKGHITGFIAPKSGYPTHLELATLLFLGTFPSTADVTFPATGDPYESASCSMVFANYPDLTAIRRLYAAWVDTRNDQGMIQLGLSQAAFTELLPAARKHADNAKLPAGTRGLALRLIGRLGGGEDLPLLKRAFADTRVWYTTKLASGTANERTIEVQVGDTAIGVALWIYGQRAADFGFPMAEMFKNHPDTLAHHGMLGFLDNDTRQAAHKKAAAWLEEHKNDKATRYEVKDWRGLFDGKTTKHWKTEGQVTIEDGVLKIGGDKGGSIVTTASYARGFVRWSVRQAGEAKAKLIWRSEEYPLSDNRVGWASFAWEPETKGESPIRIVAPPGTTLLINELAFRPY
jgi:RNA polymerase sigma factor (sigma-70 family)